MSSPDTGSVASGRLSDALSRVQRETLKVVRTAAAFDDVAVREPSLCEGWTRAHVLTHLARNADSLVNLVHWATTGEPRPQYPSAESRSADIEAGADRSAAELLTDLEDACARFAEAASTLAGEAELAEMEVGNHVPLLGVQVPEKRLHEVVFHHVDLRAGFAFSDADPECLPLLLEETVRRMRRSDRAPDLKLRSQEGDVWSIGAGSAYVTGTRAALLLWLGRGITDGVHSDGTLPALPSWG